MEQLEFFDEPKKLPCERIFPWSVQRTWGKGLVDEQSEIRAYAQRAEDPMLAESQYNRGRPPWRTWQVIYSLYCPPGGFVVDPTCGGNIRGIVAADMGLRYLGIDLSERVLMNTPRDGVEYVQADCMEYHFPECDLICSSLPYGRLERYGGGEKDLSEMEYEDFIDTVCALVRKSLKAAPFVAFEVGSYREGKKYRPIAADVMSRCSKYLYDEMIIHRNASLTAWMGQKNWEKSRKLVRCHSTVMVFHR